MFGRGYSDRHGRSGIDGGMSLPGVRWPSRPRRRPGANISRRELDNDEPAVITSAKRAIQINDSEQVWEFYDHRFKCVQQTACKLIAKAFVKTIAPKKQANNPYIKGDAMAPSWWPKPWGPGPKDKVRHVEPDHQWKKGLDLTPLIDCDLRAGSADLVSRACAPPEAHTQIGYRTEASRYPKVGRQHCQIGECRHGDALALVFGPRQCQ